MSGITKLQKILAILKRAREILTDRKRWVKGTSARAKNENEVCIGLMEDNAYAFCLSGAVYRAGFELYPKEKLYDPLSLTEQARERLTPFLPKPFLSVTVFNDDKGTKHKQILEVLDKTIVSIETPKAKKGKKDGNSD